MVIWFFSGVSLLLLLASAVLFVANRKYSNDRKVLKRMQQVMPKLIEDSRLEKKSKDYEYKISSEIVYLLGIRFSTQLIINCLLFLLGTALFFWYFFGIQIALLITFVLLFSMIFYLLNRQLKQRKLLVSQLPLFIDQLIRSLSTGRSIESAIQLVNNDSPKPLSQLIEKVIRATSTGAGFTDALVREMQSSRIKELVMIALGIKISNTYGSSPKEMLLSVMQMINQQEEARRELAVLTGETKLSALILIFIPIIILGYLIFMNPSYIEMMTSNQQGLSALKVAASMQIIGALIFWRMLKSL